MSVHSAGGWNRYIEQAEYIRFAVLLVRIFGINTRNLGLTDREQRMDLAAETAHFELSKRTMSGIV